MAVLIEYDDSYPRGSLFTLFLNIDIGHTSPVCNAHTSMSNKPYFLKAFTAHKVGP